MMIIDDLSAASDLDSAKMRFLRGGSALPSLPGSFFSITNAPIIDSGFHHLAQGQALGVDQSHNLGGLNLVVAEQAQKGISGQVAA